MQLLQKYGINLFKLLKNIEQLFVVLSDELVATEACPSIDDEIILFLVKHVIFILIGCFYLEFVPDNQSHETKGETEVLVKQHPIMINVINTMSFSELEPLLQFRLVDPRNIECFQLTIHLAEYDVILLCDIALTCLIIERLEVFPDIKGLLFNAFQHVPIDDVLGTTRLLDTNLYLFRVGTYVDLQNFLLFLERIDEKFELYEFSSTVSTHIGDVQIIDAIIIPHNSIPVVDLKVPNFCFFKFMFVILDEYQSLHVDVLGLVIQIQFHTLFSTQGLVILFIIQYRSLLNIQNRPFDLLQLILQKFLEFPGHVL